MAGVSVAGRAPRGFHEVLTLPGQRCRSPNGSGPDLVARDTIHGGGPNCPPLSVVKANRVLTSSGCLMPIAGPSHLEFLERHRAEIRAAGPLIEADGLGAGGLWLVEAEDPAAVTALVERYPFW